MIELYPVTASNAPLWIIVIPFVVLCLWHIVQLLFHKFVPPGYKHDKEMDALVQDCASLAHPADNWKPVKDAKVFAHDTEPTKNIIWRSPYKTIEPTPKDCKPKIPRGYTRHYGGLLPVAAGTKCSVLLRYAGPFTTHKPEKYRWTHTGSHGDIMAYRVLSSAKKATTKAKKARKKPAKQPAKKVTMRKKNGKLPKVQKRKVR